MRSRSLLPALLLGAGLLAPALVRVPAAEKTDAARVTKLVEQLGSGDFEEREKASKELDAIGAPALEALRKAVASEDAEVRHRAQDLVRKIERRTASARILAPTRVHLVYKDTPLPEAVADFKKKSGYEIVLHDPENKLTDRKIALDTGETTFWHALDLFCRKAGVHQAGPQDLWAPPPPGLPGAPQPIQPQFGGGRGGRAPVQPPGPVGAAPPAAPPGVMVRRGAGRMRIGQVPGQITLINGRPDAPPTDDTRAVRVRAVSNAAPEGQALLSLEIAPEPKLQWQQLVSVRVVRAVDDQGQQLSQASDGPAAPAFGVFGGGRGRRAGIVVAQPAVFGGPAVLWDGPYPQALVRLKKGEKPAKSLKELTGALGAQVLTEPQPVLTADNVLQAAGKSFKGKEGGSITVNEVVKGSDGKITIRYELRQPPDVWPAGNQVRRGLRAVPLPIQAANGAALPIRAAVQMQAIQAQIQIQGQPQVQIFLAPDGTTISNNNGVNLLDDKGKVLPTSTTVKRKQNGVAFTLEYELVYQPRKGQGEPARLVFFGRKSVAIDIPFALKNVPLP